MKSSTLEVTIKSPIVKDPLVECNASPQKRPKMLETPQTQIAVILNNSILDSLDPKPSPKKTVLEGTATILDENGELPEIPSEYVFL